MGGAFLNMLAVIFGSFIGLTVGNRLSTRIQESVVFGLGLVTLYIGFSNAGQTGNPVIPLVSIAVGVIIGELLNIQGALEAFGNWLQTRFATRSTTAENSADQTRFITGFVTASMIFCIGPLTVIGSLQDGMGLASGFQQILIKSILDLFASVAFATTFGVGVAFSAVTILVIQGGLSLVGMAAGNIFTTPMINEMTATGGLLLIGLGIILLGIKQPRMANFLPAVLLAPLLVAVATAVGLNLYPF